MCPTGAVGSLHRYPELDALHAVHLMPTHNHGTDRKTRSSELSEWQQLSSAPWSTASSAWSGAMATQRCHLKTAGELVTGQIPWFHIGENLRGSRRLPQ